MTDHNSPRRVIKAGSHAGKGIAVFTSGGDSQGKVKVTGCQRKMAKLLFYLNRNERCCESSRAIWHLLRLQSLLHP